MEFLPFVYEADFGYSLLIICSLFAVICAGCIWQERRERQERKTARYLKFATDCALTYAQWRNNNPAPEHIVIAEPDSWLSDPFCRAGFEDVH